MSSSGSAALAMKEYAISLLGRYSRKGILVDTNLLLLYFIGITDPDQIERSSRIRQSFVKEDFYTLEGVLERFEVIITTPHVLTEVSNLLGQLSGNLKTQCFEAFAREITRFTEEHTPGRHLMKMPQFIHFGIADIGIYDSAKLAYLVLTDDLPLSAYLQNKGVAVLNFNHIRELNYY